jgi:hypothetical protein
MLFPFGAFYFMYSHFICVLFYVQLILCTTYSMYNLFYVQLILCTNYSMGVQYIALDFVCTCIASGDFPYISEEPVGSTLYKI